MWPAQATLSVLLAELHQLSLSSGGEEHSPPFTPQHSSHSILFSTVSKPKQPARLEAHGQPVIKPGPEKLARKTQIPCLYPTEASLMERRAWSSHRKCMRWFLSSSPISWGLEISTIALYLSFSPFFSCLLSLALDLWQPAHLRAPVLWWVQWTGMQQESLDQGDFTLLHVFPGLSVLSVESRVCDSGWHVLS